MKKLILIIATIFLIISCSSPQNIAKDANNHVNEWNSYYYSGRYRNIIESSIDYDPNEKYGLKFEYKLYQVFAYVQWKYGLKLQGLSMTEVR